MEQEQREPESGCGCCRRDFMGAMGAAAGGAALIYHALAAAGQAGSPAPSKKQRATVRGAFLYPPSKSLHGRWWSWPGNDFDAEGRQKQYAAGLQVSERKLGLRIAMDPKPLHTRAAAAKFIAEVNQAKPDGLLLIPFHHPTFRLVDEILKGTKGAIPTVIYSCLGVKHGPVKQYQRPGVCLIQALDDLDAIESAMRMVQTRRTMAESRILSVAGARPPREAAVPFWGTKVRVIPLKQFSEEVGRTAITDEVKALARDFVRRAKKKLEPSNAAVVQAARVHFANMRLLEVEQADAIMMDCLRRGEMMPCMSFMTLRDEGIAAGCENDLYAIIILMLRQHLFDRPGFQHNPCFDTEQNHYFASHCTSASRLFGTGKPQEPHLLRSFAHTNDPTCVPQVLWRENEPVTLARLLPGKTPAMLLYTGSVVKSYPMPPVGGCRTNVAITIHELDDVCDVKGHHNILICGDYGRQLKRFAQLYGIKVST